MPSRTALDVLIATSSTFRAALTEARRQLTWWQTEVMIRHIEAPTELAAANSCTWCGGSGWAHFCVFGHDHKDVAGDECFHPNKEEVKKLRDIQAALALVIIKELAPPDTTVSLSKILSRAGVKDLLDKEESPAVRAMRYGPIKIPYPSVAIGTCPRCKSAMCDGHHDE